VDPLPKSLKKTKTDAKPDFDGGFRGNLNSPSKKGKNLVVTREDGMLE
jgi:hypothetical protein